MDKHRATDGNLNLEQYHYQFVQRWRCPVPQCNSDDLRAVKGRVPNGDGTDSRWTECRACGHRFMLVIEG